MDFLSRRYLMCLCISFIAPIFLLGISPDRLRPVFACLILCFCSAFFIAAVIKKLSGFPFGIRIDAFMPLCAAVLSVSCLIALYMFSIRDLPYEKYDGCTARVRAAVTDVSKQMGAYTLFTAKADKINSDDVNCSITVFMPSAAEVMENDIVIFDAELKLANNQGSSYSQLYLKRNHIVFSGETAGDGVFAVMGKYSDLLTRLAKLNKYAGYILDFRLNPETSAFSKALLLGDRDYLSDTLSRDFARIGVSHLLALSGMHLSLEIGLIEFALKQIIRKRTLLYSVIIAAIAFLLLFIGMPGSLMRAGIMLSICYAGKIAGKRPDPLTALMLTAAVIIAADICAALDIGFFLSFISTLGILLMMPYMQNFKHKHITRRIANRALSFAASFVFDSLALSFCACTFTGIALFFLFDSVSLIGSLSTLIFTPLIVVFIILSLTVLCFNKVKFICNAACAAAEYIYSLVHSMSNELSELPAAAVSSHNKFFIISLVILASLLILTVYLNKPVRCFAVLSAVIRCSLAVVIGVFSLTYASVTHARIIGEDSSENVILTEGFNSTVIDMSGGGASDSLCVADAVFDMHCTKIKIFMLTRYHSKNVSMLQQIDNRLPISELLLPTPVNDSDRKYSSYVEEFAHSRKIPVKYYSCSGDILSLSGCRVEVLPLARNKPTSRAQVVMNIGIGSINLLVSSGCTDDYAYHDSFSSLLERADVVYN